MELRNLKTFQLAAEYLNFTKAAQELNFSQPTVTAQIQSLEQELNQQLFLRLGKKTFLTPAGEILKRYTDQIFTLIDGVEAELGELTHPNGELTIAASESFCTHYFPSIISEYLKSHPSVNIKLLSCHSNEVIKGIESNKFDIGIISGELIKPGIFNLVVDEDEDLLLVVSKHLHDRYPVEELIHEFPFIQYRIEGEFDIRMKTLLNESRYSPGKIIEFGSLEAIRRAVLNQIGIGMLNVNLIKKELLSGEIVPLSLTDMPVKVKTSLITLEEKSTVATIKSFTEVVRTMWNQVDEQAL